MAADEVSSLDARSASAVHWSALVQAGLVRTTSVELAIAAVTMMRFRAAPVAGRCDSGGRRPLSPA